MLGPLAVPCPTLNVGTSFPAVINAALGSAATSYTFSPYTDDTSFELGASDKRAGRPHCCCSLAAPCSPQQAVCGVFEHKACP